MKFSVQKRINDIKNEQKKLRRALNQKLLSDSQIKKLSHRKIFTNDKMKIYGKLGVSKEDLKEIEKKKKQNKGDIPDSALSHILCFRLSLNEVNEIILKQLSQSKSKKELEEEFEVIWKGFMEKVPKFGCISLHQIEAEVETALLKHVGPQGGDTKLKDMLLQKSLTDYKQEDLSLEFTDSHFAVTGYTSPVRK